jgi:hypothetical protein
VRTTAVRVLLVSGLLMVSQVAWAQGRHRPPKYPWHLADVWWTSGAPTPAFSELAIDFEIVGDVADGVHLYIAPLGLVTIGGIPAYGGIQTAISGWPGKNERRLVPIGRGGIFSRWSENDEPLTLDAATGPPGTHYEAADYEDQFLSVRRRLAWKSGRYTYILRRAKRSGGLWFTASVKEQASGSETEIGALRFDEKNPSLDESIAAFVEVYGSTSVIPQVTIIFSEPRVDGARRPATEASITYPDNDADGSIRFASATKSGGRVVVTTIPAGVRNPAGRGD